MDQIREIIYFSTALFIFHANIKQGTYIAITHDFIYLAYSKNSLCFPCVGHSDSIVSMFKNFCRCNAAESDFYNSKSKNKIAVVFFS